MQVLQELTGLKLNDKLIVALYHHADIWLLLLLPYLQVLQELTGLTLNDKLIVAISSITKMFVGELIETGEDVKQVQRFTRRTNVIQRSLVGGNSNSWLQLCATLGYPVHCLTACCHRRLPSTSCYCVTHSSPDCCTRGPQWRANFYSVLTASDSCCHLCPLLLAHSAPDRCTRGPQ
jgi:hypothetical protein